VFGQSYDPQFEASWYALLSADLSWQMSKRSKSAEEDQLVLDTVQKYWAVPQAQEKVDVAELRVPQAELALKITRLQVQVGLAPAPGMSPQQALSSAEAALAKARADLATAQNELDSAYEALNRTIGLWPQDRPVLVDGLEFEPVEVDDLDMHVRRVLDASPSIWLAEEAVTMAEYAQELMWAKGQYTPYEVREIEARQAKLDASSARDAVRQATRDLYYTVRNLENAYTVAGEGVKTAEEALRITRLLFEVGMVTATEVTKQEVALAEAEQARFDLAVQHAYTKLAFQKPWAIGTGK
ncbi:MAG: TolC family protein, partial [Candidatus Desulforudis sp.]|nr:TolC family protein [Desulforudis sp.]